MFCGDKARFFRKTPRFTSYSSRFCLMKTPIKVQPTPKTPNPGGRGTETLNRNSFVRGQIWCKYPWRWGGKPSCSVVSSQVYTLTTWLKKVPQVICLASHPIKLGCVRFSIEQQRFLQFFNIFNQDITQFTFRPQQVHTKREIAPFRASKPPSLIYPKLRKNMCLHNVNWSFWL